MTHEQGFLKGFKSTDIRAIKVPDVFTPVISFGKDAQAPRKYQAFDVQQTLSEPSQ